MQINCFIAHVREKDNEVQTLESHLLGVAGLSKQTATKMGMSEAGELIGLLHDLGKYSQQFQQYIGSATGCINPDEDDYVDDYNKTVSKDIKINFPSTNRLKN